MAEVQKVLSDPEINASITANLTTEKAGMLNDALASDQPGRLRTVLKNPEIFAATHKQVDATRARIEAQQVEREPDIEQRDASEPSPEQDTQQTSDLLESLTSEFSEPLDPKDLPPSSPPIQRGN